MSQPPENAKIDPRIFIGVHAMGIVYADRGRLADGDYAVLGRIAFSDLTSEISNDCPAELRAQIEADMTNYRIRKGEAFQISGSGQTVTLGYDVLDIE